MTIIVKYYSYEYKIGLELLGSVIMKNQVAFVKMSAI